MDNIIKWLWLHEKVCLSRSKQYHLLEHFGNIENIYKANLSDYAEMDIFSAEELNLLTKKDLDSCLVTLDKMTNLGGKIITIDSPDYPELLKTIHDPPTVLYCRGHMPDMTNRLAIAMVGTRKATNYGKSCAFKFARELSLSGAVVVSGMALGIDAKSHEGALAGDTPTIAVVGSGVDLAYPKANAPLMKDILKTGAVISEYPLGTTPEKYHFPERNRIISGLCHGTLVVEADFKSGSLITAKSATEQDRDVFAVPGNITSVYSKGTNYLIKDGAHVATCVEDILSYYRFDYPHLFTAQPVRISAETDTQTSVSKTPEDKILAAIGEGSIHTDTICEISKLDIATLNATLLMLELSGKVIKLPGGFYSRT